MEFLGTCSAALRKAHIEHTQSHDYFSHVRRGRAENRWSAAYFQTETRARASATEHAFQNYELSRDVRFENMA